MNDILTPRQIGRAIQVSESSIKRWCDKGKIKTSYTAGGHRRVQMADFLTFIKTHKQPLVHPEAVGLPPNLGSGTGGVEQAREVFFKAISSGEEERARQVVYELYLAEHSMARICDQVFSPAFHRIGELWQCGEAEVYEERRACEIAKRLLNELRSLIPAASDPAPIAIGATPSGDPYGLATQSVELVFRDHRWQAVSLGSDLPFDTLREAIEDYRPQMFWLSISHVADRESLVQGYRKLHAEMGGKCQFILGGQAIDSGLLSELPCSHFCQNLGELESLLENTEAPARTPELENPSRFHSMESSTSPGR